MGTQHPSTRDEFISVMGEHMKRYEGLQIVFSDDKKADVKDYKKKFKFMPGEKIRLTKGGQTETLYVQGTTDDGKYTLCNEEDETVKDGEAFEEKDLESA